MSEKGVAARIYLVRHGETTANREGIIQGQTDTKLNELGVKQASLVAGALKAVTFDLAFSSDLSRASETAKAILTHHEGVELKKQKELRERLMGGLEGNKLGPQQFRTAIKTDNSVETSSEFTKRFTDWWTRIILQSTLSKYDGKPLNVLVATHGGVIVGLIKEMLGSRKVQAAENVIIGKCMNASVTIIDVHSDKKGVLVQYGGIAHLDGLEALESGADQVGT